MNKNILTKEQKNRKINKIILAVFLGLFLVFFFVLYITDVEKQPNHNTAQKISREFITKTLIDPESAEFIDDNLQYTIFKDSTYTFRGVVKSTNMMGLSSPSEYTIIMKWKGGSHSDINQWNVVDYKIK